MQARNAVNGFFDRTRHGDHHLVNGHDAVFYGDQDSRKIRLRKHGDGNGESQIDAERCQSQNQKNYGSRVTGKSEGRVSTVIGRILWLFISYRYLALCWSRVLLVRF